MKYLPRWSWLAVGLLHAPAAFAYVDPNAPGLLFQLLFPLMVALAVARDWLVGLFRSVVSVIRRKR